MIMLLSPKLIETCAKLGNDQQRYSLASKLLTKVSFWRKAYMHVITLSLYLTRAKQVTLSAQLILPYSEAKKTRTAKLEARGEVRKLAGRCLCCTADCSWARMTIMLMMVTTVTKWNIEDDDPVPTTHGPGGSRGTRGD